ncbi:MAG: hypothetical protein AAFX93_05700 [Verrucomicrobiota bacterium]
MSAFLDRFWNTSSATEAIDSEGDSFFAVLEIPVVGSVGSAVMSIRLLIMAYPSVG